MRLYDFADGLVKKFSPISPTEASDLNQQSVKTYATLKKEAEEIKFHNEVELEKTKTNPEYRPDLKPLGLKYKAVLFLETWYVRYIVAFVFIFVVRKVQKWLTETEREIEEEEIPD